MLGGSGDDTLVGSIGDDTMVGGLGSDILEGGDGNDILDGRYEEITATLDYLNGGAGDDQLVAGALDNLTGGAGADQFWLDGDASAEGSTDIEDFDASEDSLVVFYDSTGDAPVLSAAAGEDGVDLMANGEVLVHLHGVYDLDLDRIALVAN